MRDDTKALERVLRHVGQATAGLDEVESLMPHWESHWWLRQDQAGTADALLPIELDMEPAAWLREDPDDDGVPAGGSTTRVAVARRCVEALYRHLDNVEGMGYVEACQILPDTLGAGTMAAAQDVHKAYEFLEDAISRVLDDAWDSREAALNRETAAVALEQDPGVVNADGRIHLSNAAGTSHRLVPIELLQDVSALAWCDEFATDAAMELKGAINALDDPEEAECLGNADRGVFTNDVLLRAGVGVILGHPDHRAYDRYEDAALHVRHLLESTDWEPDELDDHLEADVQTLRKAYLELVRTAREAAAACSAYAALQQRLSALVRTDVSHRSTR